MPKLDVGNEMVNVDGNMVEQDALRIAEALTKYDPNLYVVCVDPAMADFNEAPFIICELQQDGQLHRIFEVWQLDETVLTRIESADQVKHNALTAIDKINADAKGIASARYEEKLLAAHDVGAHVLKSKKSSYTAPNAKGELTRFFDDRPAEPEKKAKMV